MRLLETGLGIDGHGLQIGVDAKGGVGSGVKLGAETARLSYLRQVNGGLQFALSPDCAGDMELGLVNLKRPIGERCGRQPSSHIACDC